MQRYGAEEEDDQGHVLARVPDVGPEDEGDMYGDEGDDVGAGGGAGLGQYNLSPETLQAIQALVNNPSFPMIRQRMI